MGPRTWRTTTTCAALLLTATGCVVGPTIEDPKPAGAAAATTDATATAGGQFPTTAPGWPTNGAAPPGDPNSPGPDSPSRPAAPKVVIGGAPHEFNQGVRIWVESVAPEPGAAGTSDTVRVALRLRIFNGDDEEFKTDGLTIEMSGCPKGRVTCKDGRGEGDKVDLQPQDSVTLVQYFRLSQTALASEAAGSVNYKGAKFQFAGPFTDSVSAHGSSSASPTPSSSSASPSPS